VYFILLSCDSCCSFKFNMLGDCQCKSAQSSTTEVHSGHVLLWIRGSTAITTHSKKSKLQSRRSAYFIIEPVRSRRTVELQCVGLLHINGNKSSSADLLGEWTRILASRQLLIGYVRPFPRRPLEATLGNFSPRRVFIKVGNYARCRGYVRPY